MASIVVPGGRGTKQTALLDASPFSHPFIHSSQSVASPFIHSSQSTAIICGVEGFCMGSI